jgi:SLOG in TRPM, prokaryote/Protein of unknown function (DUF4231)
MKSHARSADKLVDVPAGAIATSIEDFEQLGPALEAVGLPCGLPVLILVGGADSVTAELAARLEPLFADAIVPAVERCRALVIDGGTNSGMMRLMGRAHANAGATFPLVGVLPERLAIDGGFLLEPNHTHFILVPGDRWGDESRFLDAVAEHLDCGESSVTLIIGGGTIASQDFAISEARRPTIALEGSAGFADQIARSRESHRQVTVVSINDPPGSLREEIVQHLGGGMPQQNYRQRLASQLAALIPSLHLRPEQSAFLQARWLDQVVWMEDRAVFNRNYYYALRGFTIVGGVTVPALVRFTATSGATSPIAIITYTLALLVALSAAIEGFFKFGDRWRHYRRTSEALKSEGWQFIELSGHYRNFEHHERAYKAFVQRIERILQQDVDSYIAQVASHDQMEGDVENPKDSVT